MGEEQPVAAAVDGQELLQRLEETTGLLSKAQNMLSSEEERGAEWEAIIEVSAL